jgi:hypothetical protein
MSGWTREIRMKTAFAVYILLKRDESVLFGDT